MSDRPEQIEQFCKISGLKEEQAERFLEAAKWDSNAALSKYFEERFEESSSDEDAGEKVPERTSSLSWSSFSEAAGQNPSSEEGVFVGGSVSSGQAVIDKPDVAGMPDQRRVVHSRFSPRLLSPIHRRPVAFSGVGHVLESGVEDQSVVAVISNSPSDGSEDTITFWRNGFMVGEGPLRKYDDPANQSFLSAIQRNEAPMELRNKARGAKIRLRIKERWHDTFSPFQRPFSGSGRRLDDTPPPPDVVSPSTADPGTIRNESCLELDENSPTTTLQVRLIDGSRMIIKANHHHTVGDIGQHIVLVRPEYGPNPFSLWASYPLVELKDPSATVKDANLLNSTVVQKSLK